MTSAEEVAGEVTCHNISRHYIIGGSHVPALRSIDLHLAAGSFAALMGPSGSGKSTLLRVLAGLDRPDFGMIRIGNIELSSLSRAQLVKLRRRRLSYMFQAPADNLVEFLTIRQHIDLAKKLRGVKVSDVQVRDMLAALGILERAHHLPKQLSGGEQQRAAIAFAAVGPPSLLLADEPTGHLDRASVDAVLRAFRTLVQGGITVVLATHDPHVASRVDRVVTMKDGVIEGSA